MRAPAVADDLEAVWNWTRDGANPPEHLHGRHERGDLVLIITGSTGGALPVRKAGLRLPRAVALELARFILRAEVTE